MTKTPIDELSLYNVACNEKQTSNYQFSYPRDMWERLTREPNLVRGLGQFAGGARWCGGVVKTSSWTSICSWNPENEKEFSEKGKNLWSSYTAHRETQRDANLPFMRYTKWQQMQPELLAESTQVGPGWQPASACGAPRPWRRFTHPHRSGKPQEGA